MKLALRLIGPVLFIVLIYFYVDLQELKNIVSDLRWPFFCISVALNPLLILLRSHRWQIILARYDVAYTGWQCYKIYFVEMVAVNVVATVGTFAKAVYLKRDGHGLLQPVLSIITEKYFDYLLPLIFGVISVFLVWLKLDSDSGLVVFSLTTCLAFFPARKAILLLATPVVPKRLKAVLLKKDWHLADHLVKIYQTLNFKIYIYSVAAFALYFASIYYLTRSLYLDLSFFQVVLIMTITSLIAFIPISFFGIGTRDAGLLAVFSFFGHSPEQAVALSMALLLLRIAVVFMGSIFWFIDPPPLGEMKEAK
ncbi:MAG: flippase-like domain-containing protein [Deltaproteobacteria bacterium]|nr:flippase-like domain-containing protein [Deltaproteobacteria bacterium]